MTGSSYWLLQQDGNPQGPFAESQLRGMWNNGRITAADQLCLMETDFWQPAAEILDVPDPDEELRKQRGKKDEWRANAQAQFEKQKRSPGLAFIWSFLLPGAGQFYCGAVFSGVLWLLLMVIILAVIFFATLHRIIIIGSYGSAWSLGIFSGASAWICAERANKRLKEKLGA